MKAYLCPACGWSRAGLAVITVCALALSGCGKKSAVLSGQVTTSDGKPVTGGDVKFIPEKPEKGMEAGFLCRLNNKGEYSISNLKPGDYKVTVDTESIKSLTSGPQGMPQGMKPPPGFEDKVKVDPSAQQGASAGLTYVQIPGKYRDANTTTLKVTVQGGHQTENFKLTE